MNYFSLPHISSCQRRPGGDGGGQTVATTWDSSTPSLISRSNLAKSTYLGFPRGCSVPRISLSRTRSDRVLVRTADQSVGSLQNLRMFPVMTVLTTWSGLPRIQVNDFPLVLLVIYFCFCVTDEGSNSVEILSSDTDCPPPLRIWKIKVSTSLLPLNNCSLISKWERWDVQHAFRKSFRKNHRRRKTRVTESWSRTQNLRITLWRTQNLRMESHNQKTW